MPIDSVASKFFLLIKIRRRDDGTMWSRLHWIVSRCPRISIVVVAAVDACFLEKCGAICPAQRLVPEYFS
jgi:hypothetical protein